MTTTLTVLGRDGYKREGSTEGEKKANPWEGIVK